MNSSLHLSRELLRSLRRRGLRPLALAGSFSVLFLALLVLFLLAWSSLGEGGEGELLALLGPQLTPSQVDQLYLEVREWEGVVEVDFVFEEEVRAGLVKLATGVPGADLLRFRLRDPREAVAVGERLEELEGITEVIPTGRGSLKNMLRAAAGARSGMIALLIVLGLLALVSIRSAIRSLIQGWKGELQLLHLAGVARGTMRAPFILLASGLGLVSGLVLVLGLYIVHSWGLNHVEAFYRSFPALLDSTVVLSLALLSAGLGLGLGLLGGAWSLLALRRLNS